MAPGDKRLDGDVFSDHHRASLAVAPTELETPCTGGPVDVKRGLSLPKPRIKNPLIQRVSSHFLT